MPPHVHRRLLGVVLGAAAVVPVAILVIAVRPEAVTITKPAPATTGAVTHAVPGAFYVSPGNLAPVGVAFEAAPVPGAFYLSPGNLAPLGVVAPATAGQG
jgi:hypothetical protein